MHEWKLRHEPGYFRSQVYLRDRGVCAACGIDTVALHELIGALAPAEQELAWQRHSISPHRRNRPAWDLDHIREVVNGGGSCGMENAQTLCCSCHKKKTARLAAQRKAQREISAAARRQL